MECGEDVGGDQGLAVACGVRVKEDRVGIVRYERVEVKNEGLRCTRVKSGRIIRLPRPSLPILQ